MTSEYACQNVAVFEHLRTAPITPKEALRLYGCFRLAARIHDLRSVGHEIMTRRIINDEGNPYAEYHLIRQAH